MMYAIKYKGNDERLGPIGGLLCDKGERVTAFRESEARELVEMWNKIKGHDAFEVVPYPQSEKEAA